MSESSVDAVATIDQRLARDGITIDEEERTRLIELVPLVQEWVRRITIPETRYAEPALTHKVK
ncbi:MAG TPA: hypothetical protein VFH48_25265 [Chloroflexota bacterium]|nr:hypothetical protein [Chloroflexota bacterium]